MVATLAATFWMARQQDMAAQTASRRMVTGGLEALRERTKAMLLDYAIWTAAYEHILAGDVDWIGPNIGASADIGTFDLAVILPPGGGTPFGWDAGGGPQADLLDPTAIATVNGLLDDVPIDSGTAEAAYVRSGGALWFLAIARVVPQVGLPAGVTRRRLCPGSSSASDHDRAARGHRPPVLDREPDRRQPIRRPAGTSSRSTASMASRSPG